MQEEGEKKEKKRFSSTPLPLFLILFPFSHTRKLCPASATLVFTNVTYYSRKRNMIFFVRMCLLLLLLHPRSYFPCPNETSPTDPCIILVPTLPKHHTVKKKREPFDLTHFEKRRNPLAPYFLSPYSSSTFLFSMKTNEHEVIFNHDYASV